MRHLLLGLLALVVTGSLAYSASPDSKSPSPKILEGPPPTILDMMHQELPGRVLPQIRKRPEPRLPSESTYTSPNWAGYVQTTGGPFTSVGVTFTLPTNLIYTNWHNNGSFPGYNYVAIWPGIDGFGNNTIAQSGAFCTDNAPNTIGCSLWMEFYPQPSFATIAASPGDTISILVSCTAHCTPNNPQATWVITQHDLTSGATYTSTPTQFATPMSTAEWIVEAPGSPTLPLAEPTGDQLNLMGATVNGKPAVLSSASSIEEENPYGMTDNPSAPSGTAFDVCYGAPGAGPSPCPIQQVGGTTVSVQLPITVLPSGASGPDMFQQQLLSLINTSRAGGGLPPYNFSQTQSNGTGSCIGSIGHSEHMAQTGTLAHDQFPADICLTFSSAGENICEWPGDEATAIANCHQAMMAEGPSGGHYQNIMNPRFTTIGLGLVEYNGVLWLTEDMIGP
jgi:uncharacterized protein YkwD